MDGDHRLGAFHRAQPPATRHLGTLRFGGEGDDLAGAVQAEGGGAHHHLGAIAAYDVAGAGLSSAFGADPGEPWRSMFLALLSLSLIAWTAPAIPVAIVEGAAPWTAVARALTLVRSNFWRVASMVWILWWVTNTADSFSVNVMYQLTGNSTVSGIFDLAVDGFLYPLRGVALAVLYFDCRVRREAYDLEAMLDAVRT